MGAKDVMGKGHWDVRIEGVKNQDVERLEIGRHRQKRTFGSTTETEMALKICGPCERTARKSSKRITDAAETFEDMAHTEALPRVLMRNDQ